MGQGLVQGGARVWYKVRLNLVQGAAESGTRCGKGWYNDNVRYGLVQVPAVWYEVRQGLVQGAAVGSMLFCNF